MPLSTAQETITFNSASFPPSPFKIKQAKGRGKILKHEPGLEISGDLQKPEGKGPFPALVLLHGCSGILKSNQDWADYLTNLGYVTLLIDSFSPRNLTNICLDPMRVASPQTRALDAHGALAYLKALAFVDAEKIALVGWSHGGNSALSAANKLGLTAKLTQHFKAFVAFYPFCMGGGNYDRPILILNGTKDQWGPYKNCEKLISRSENGGPTISMITYPNAFHAFDMPEFKEGISVKGSAGLNHWIEYQEEAHKDSQRQVRSFLAEHLNQK